MKKFKNMKFLVAALALALILMLPLSVFADSDRVVDSLGVLTDEEEEALEEKLGRLSAEYGHDIAVVTTGSLDGKDLDLYARDYFEYMNYGMGDDDSGVMLLFYMDGSDTDKKYYSLVLHGEADRIFTESDETALVEVFRSDLKNGHYFDAFDAYADKCENIIVYDNRLEPVWIVISLVVGAAVGGIVLGVMCSKYKSVRFQRSANSYMRRDTFRLDRSRDVYLYSHVTRRVKPQNNGSSSSGGGRSSSGRSYGGRSGRL